jgi:hypothetical protein
MHFTIRTDQVSLKYILKHKVTLSSQHFWLAKLLGFDFDIEYKKGKDNATADALFRNSSGEVFIMAISIITTSIIEQIRESWANNWFIQAITRDL